MNLKIQIKWVDKQKKQAYNKTTGENLWFICFCNLITRGGAVRKLVGLITRRSQVQILSPLFSERRHVSLPWDVAFFITLNFMFQEIIYAKTDNLKKFFYFGRISSCHSY